MPQAKFTLSEAQFEFVDRHEEWGYPDKSSLVRDALDKMRAKLAQKQLDQSAELYAEIYAEEEDLRQLTESALEDWPA